MRRNLLSWTVLVVANVVVWCVLSLYRPTSAAPQGGRQPFSNAVEQRHDIVRELRKIGTLLEEQNRLLRTMAKSAQTPKRKSR